MQTAELIEITNTVEPKAFDAVLPRLEKLNRKAKKLGLPLIAWTVEATEPKRKMVNHLRDENDAIIGGTGVWVNVPQVIVTLKGAAPVIEGWSLVARIETFEGDSNLVHAVPGQEFDLSEYRTRRHCDHCNTNRYRKDTLVITKDGVLKQVGRNCLADYLRNPSAAADLIQWLHCFDELETIGHEMSGFHGESHEYMVKDIVTLACACVRQFGYMSATKHREMSEAGAEFIPETTASRIRCHFYATERPTLKNRDSILVTVDTDTTEAVEALAWIAAHPTTDSEYITNLQLMAGVESVDNKKIGYLASLPTAFARANDRLKKVAEEAAANALNPSEFVGQVGDKVKDIKITVKRVTRVESEYGTSDLISMIDETGNVYTWFASNLKYSGGCDCQVCKEGYSFPVHMPEEGDTAILKGTIKAHKECRGQKQTALTRAKLIKA